MALTGELLRDYPPALVVGTGTMGLAVIRALGEKGVPVIAISYDPADIGYLSKYVQKVYHVPHPEREQVDFIDALDEIIHQYVGGVLFPVSDASLVAVSRYKNKLQSCVKVACTGWETTELFIDKKRTYELAEAAGVACPKTIVPTSDEDMDAYSRSIQYPCLVKPTHGHLYNAYFGRKMTLAHNADELREAYRQAATAGFEVMLQEFIPGDDTMGVNYNAYVHEGQVVAEFTAQKVRSAPPQTGSPSIVYSSHIPEVIDQGRKILQAMNFTGYACTEFKLDERDGIFKLMEVNGRHNLSGLLAVRSGMDFPWMHYLDMMSGILPQVSDYKKGLYWIDINRDIYYTVKAAVKNPRAVWKLIKPYFKPHVNAIWDWNDPKPFLKRAYDLATRPFSRERTPRASKQ